jgi:uncharacterized membrane protein YhhN
MTFVELVISTKILVAASWGQDLWRRWIFATSPFKLVLLKRNGRQSGSLIRTLIQATGRQC